MSNSEFIINDAILAKEPATKKLVTFLKELDESGSINNNIIYHRFPIYPEEEIPKLTADIIVLNKSKWVVIFSCLNGKGDIKEAGEILSEFETVIFTRLLRHSTSLRLSKREIKCDIDWYVFLADEEINWYTINTVNSKAEILSKLNNASNEQLTEEEFNDLKSTIEWSKAFPKPIERVLSNPEKQIKGRILNHITAEINNFDLEQKRAALQTLDWPQRIRWLAWSWKTIILAMKVAQIHLQDPTAAILYTYYTKNLYEYVKKLITKFYRMYKEEDPNWDKIFLMHAWWWQWLKWVYYQTCVENWLPSLDFFGAKNQLLEKKVLNLTNVKWPFDYACQELLKYPINQKYDYILIDEAQDFWKNFYQLCFKLVKNKRIIWAYDDFQNILDIDIQDEKETFWKDSEWNPLIDFSKYPWTLQDIILKKCYRNPKLTLITAFSFWLGIYNTKIIQRLENNENWENLGFEVENGDSSVWSNMIISRPDKNSPLAKNSYLWKHEEIIDIKKLGSFIEECQYVLSKIEADIEQWLNPEDITIICLDDKNARAYLNFMQSNLKWIWIFDLMKAPTNTTFYRIDNCITYSSIYRAKWNESASVYIMWADAIFRFKDSPNERNKLFTALTRSIAWVTVTWIGNVMDYCISEFDALVKNNFKLNFIQPKEEDVNVISQQWNHRQKEISNTKERIQSLADELWMTLEEFTKMHIYNSEK